MKKILISILILAAIAGCYLAWTKWIHPLAEKNKSDNMGMKNADSDIDYYHCGMHPWITSDKPGKCPICGMDLTSVYKNNAINEKGVVQIDPAMIQNIGVKTETVTKRKLTHTTRTTGIV